MSNIYHIIDFIPGIEKEEMIVGYEELAQKLVSSGRLRIDMGDKINFARLYIPDLNISMMFSYREIYDPHLLEKTLTSIETELRSSYKGQQLEIKKNQYLEILKKELHKYPQPTLEEEAKLARLLVQTSHPVVIMLAIIENAEIYISHSYNIGDTLDIITWQAAGSNSGMQSTNGKDIGIFVSCGGNPLSSNTKDNATYGDGWPAIARLLVIGGQELGHYSDIMRDSHGRQFSRYSANFSATRAKENVRVGRLNDIHSSKAIYKNLTSKGLLRLVSIENNLKFYNKNNKNSFAHFKVFIQSKLKRLLFFFKLTKHEKSFLKKFRDEKHAAIIINSMIEDMLFNLSPKADAYKRDDIDAEEAVACVEALARVPQQVNKWGHKSTKALMPNLYKIYYGIVIPGCIASYVKMTGSPFTFNNSPMKTNFIYKFKSLFKKRTWPTREVE